VNHDPLAGIAGDADLILADFRRWLEATPAGDPVSPETVSEPPAIDLHTVLSHFVALRQEVNLQTRSVRAQQEQNAELLRELQQATEALRNTQTRAEQSVQQGVEEALRPVLKTLVDLYDSLSLAGREIQRAQTGMAPLLQTLVEVGDGSEEPTLPKQLGQTRSFWSRWFLSAKADAAFRASQGEKQQTIESGRQEHFDRQQRIRDAGESCRRVQEVLQALVTGYTMSLQRIERGLRQHGLEPIPTVGERFDPERMEAVDVVRDSGRPAGEVVEELRRGYLWNGRVFRFAQVRVARD
jgi:molecular chaperone GrpE